jgi:hypothetical protein
MIGRAGRLRSYVSAAGQSREIVSIAAAEGSRLIVDRRSDGADERLLAHLAADEPDANATIVCDDYLASARHACRPLRPRDRELSGEGIAALRLLHAPPPSVLVDADGAHYRLAMSAAPRELRWQREQAGLVRVVSAREVVAALQDYEPACEWTRAAIRTWRNDRSVSVATLGLELRRLEASPIVLNRSLREAVLRAVCERGVSLSAIAIACGREKRDPRGNGSGETSWLLRRVGLAPDRPKGNCNPWVHSDTLALIARDGLGIAPREVELG